MAGQSVAHPLTNINTPVPGRRLRSAYVAATSVMDATFPPPGTRASVIRDQKEREARGTPYEPPKGTRASKHKARLPI